MADDKPRRAGLKDIIAKKQEILSTGNKDLISKMNKLVDQKAPDLKNQLGSGSDLQERLKYEGPREHIKSDKLKYRGGREKISTRTTQALKSGDDFVKSIANKRAMKKLGKAALSGLPLVGGVASALSSGDVSAAVPIIGDSEALGPREGSLESMVENPDVSPEDRKRAIEALTRRDE